MTTCEKATLLMVKSSEIKLSTAEKFNLKFHTMFCKACKLFETQNQQIDKALSSKETLEENEVLSTTKKQEINAIIEKELNQ